MSELSQKRLIVVVGPTAVGKTKLAIHLAKCLHTEIISADSRQLYKEMTIGTAKPSARELAEIQHHFVDEVPVAWSYDAAQYGHTALALIHQLFMHYDDLVLCGGSGLYVRAVLEGFDDMPSIAPGIRNRIIEEYNQKGITWLQEQVKTNDPDYFGEVDQKNPQRLMRALEIIRSTGKPATEFRKKKKYKHSFKVIKIGLELRREELYKIIDQRVDKMIEQGLMKEARALYPWKESNALQTVGYQEWFAHFDGEYDFKEAVRLMKRNTRRYAKRQLTWFKKDNEIKWFHPDEVEKMLAYIDGK